MALTAVIAAGSAEAVSWIASIALGAVLIAAGGLKLGAGQRWTAQARSLGVATPVAAAVPWLELGVGAVTATRLAAPAGAIAAAALLVAFTAFLVVRITAGQAAPCACFGSWSTRPIGWLDVSRNLLLIAVATLIVTLA